MDIILVVVMSCWLWTGRTIGSLAESRQLMTGSIQVAVLQYCAGADQSVTLPLSGVW